MTQKLLVIKWNDGSFNSIIKWACFLSLIFCLSLFCCLSGCLNQSDESDIWNNSTDTNRSFTITDPLSKNITLQGPVQRIVSQNGAVTELLIDIGAGEEVVGVTDAVMKKEYLTKNLPNAVSVGDFYAPSIEILSTLHPDVMIIYNIENSMPRNMVLIQTTKIPVFSFGCYRITTMSEEARTLGKLIGREEEAEKYAEFNEKYISLIQSRLGNISESEKIRIYFESSGENYAYGPGSAGNDIIQLLNAKNIAQNLSDSSDKVSPEWIIKENPEVIFKYTTATGEHNVSIVWENIVNRTGFTQIKAVQNQRVYVTTDLINTPRCVVGLVYFAKALYPTRFSDIDPDDVLHEYAEHFLPGADQIESFYPSLSLKSHN